MSNEAIVRWEYALINWGDYNSFISEGRAAIKDKDELAGTGTPMPEHLIHSITSEAQWRLDRMNELGSEGWELVNEMERSLGHPTTLAILKRPYKLCPQCDVKVLVGLVCDDCSTSSG